MAAAASGLRRQLVEGPAARDRDERGRSDGDYHPDLSVLHVQLQPVAIPEGPVLVRRIGDRERYTRFVGEVLNF